MNIDGQWMLLGMLVKGQKFDGTMSSNGVCKDVTSCDGMLVADHPSTNTGQRKTDKCNYPNPKFTSVKEASVVITCQKV